MQSEVKEFLHLSGAECFVFQFSVQKCKDQDVQNCNLAGCFAGFETLSLTLREECRLKVFENRMLRRIFGSKRDEVRGEWRRLHNEELYALFSSPNIIRAIQSRRQMGGACSMYGRE